MSKGAGELRTRLGLEVVVDNLRVQVCKRIRNVYPDLKRLQHARAPLHGRFLVGLSAGLRGCSDQWS